MNVLVYYGYVDFASKHYKISIRKRSQLYTEYIVGLVSQLYERTKFTAMLYINTFKATHHS